MILEVIIVGKCKKFCNLFILLMILILMSGCNQYQGKYTFWRQEKTSVQKVEICSYDSYSKERTVIAQLSNDDAQEILDEISNLECSQWGPGDHPREYGPIIICVTYLDGEIEMIGFYNIGYITVDGTRCLTPYFFEDSRAFYLLICKYVEPQLLPDISNEYPQWFAQGETG